MTRQHRTSPPSRTERLARPSVRTVCGVLVAGCVAFTAWGVFAVATQVQAQEASPQEASSPETPAPATTPQTPAAPELTPDLTTTPAETVVLSRTLPLIATEEPKSIAAELGDRSDGFFKTLVKYLESALFYPFFQTRIEFVDRTVGTVYGRPATDPQAKDKSNEPFVRLRPALRETDTIITVKQIQSVLARGTGTYRDASGRLVTTPYAIAADSDGQPQVFVPGADPDAAEDEEDLSGYRLLAPTVVLDASDTKTLAELQDQIAAEAGPASDPLANPIRKRTFKDAAGQTINLDIIDLTGTTRYLRLDDGRFYQLVTQRKVPSRDPGHVLTLEDVTRLAAEGEIPFAPTGSTGSISPAAELDASTATPAIPSVVQVGYQGGIPFTVGWLAIGALVFTLWMRGFNLWGFWHAIRTVLGHYDDPKEPGEVTHAQALASALSGTVGLGNIGGVALAMGLGGPGAFFWMLMSGFLGMTLKFVECTLGQMYRKIDDQGRVQGGPMEYLYDGLKERGLAPLGIVLSLMFSVFCVMASFGGGNMFQANQAGEQVLALFQRTQNFRYEAIQAEIEAKARLIEDASPETPAADTLRQEIASLREEAATISDNKKSFAPWFKSAFGLLLALATGVVIIGGIKRIANVASAIVPSMCLMYLAGCLWVIVTNISQVPEMVGLVFTEAFSPQAIFGGALGVLVVGFQRAAFSNEAGVGSAAIAHSAAKTDEPIREGCVALLEPFIDTIVVCSMTAMVILLTGAWNNPAYEGLEGIRLTSKAFGEQIAFFPYLLGIAATLFAYSTIISWSYYGERAWQRLFGYSTILLYKIIFITAVFFGAVFNLGAVLTFSDMMILAMAFPNILGLYLLGPKVSAALTDYWNRYKSGQFAEDRTDHVESRPSAPAASSDS